MNNNPLGIVIVNDGFQPLHGVQIDLFGELNDFISEEYCLVHYIGMYYRYFSVGCNTLNGFLENFFHFNDVELVMYRMQLRLNLDNFSHIDPYKPILMFGIACVISECNVGLPISSMVFDNAYSIFHKLGVHINFTGTSYAS